MDVSITLCVCVPFPRVTGRAAFGQFFVFLSTSKPGRQAIDFMMMMMRLLTIHTYIHTPS